MDPFEEFEFKPLTEGLGFHKKKSSTPAKTTDLDSEFQISGPTQDFKQNGLSLLEETTDPLRSPLPRKNTSPSVEPEPSTTASAVDEILKTLQKNRRLDFDKKTVTATTPQKEEYRVATWNFSSAFLDT
ncbi:metalloendopeptidase, partial [bacterium]